MDDYKQIDEIFKSKLSGYEPQFEAEHWHMMQNVLKSTPSTSKSKSFFNSRNLLVASTLLIVISGIYIYFLLNKLKNIEKQYQVNHKQLIVADENPKSERFTNDNLTHQNNLLPKNNLKAVGNSHTTVKAASGYQQKNNQSDLAKLVPDPIEKFDNSHKTAQSQIEDSKVFISGNQQENSAENLSEVVDKQNADFELKLKDTQDDVVDESIVNTVVEENKSKKEKKKITGKNQKNSKETNAAFFADSKVQINNSFVSNPAFAGFNQRHSLYLATLINKPLYKPTDGMNTPFEYSLGYDFTLGKRSNYALGINYRRYLGGAEGSLSLDLSFAYRFRLGDHHRLRLGISASYLASDVNTNNLSFPDMIDYRDGFVYGTSEDFKDKSVRSNFDLGAGIWYNWKTFYIGTSVVHIVRPEVGVITRTKIPRELIFTTGYGINQKKDLGIMPSIEARYNGIRLYLNPSLLLSYKKWYILGFEFQNLKNAGLILGYNYKNHFIIQAKAGIPMNKDLIQNFGIVEYAGIRLRFQFGEKR